MNTATETYEAKAYCTNCPYGRFVERILFSLVYTHIINIPKGMSVKQFLKDKACPECGCTTLTKAN